MHGFVRGAHSIDSGLVGPVAEERAHRLAEDPDELSEALLVAFVNGRLEEGGRVADGLEGADALDDAIAHEPRSVTAVEQVVAEHIRTERTC